MPNLMQESFFILLVANMLLIKKYDVVGSIVERIDVDLNIPA